jgi:hypothetical protein
VNGKIDFIIEFRVLATQLNTYAIAGRWMRLREEVPTLTAQEAAAWAGLGYLPEEAESQIRAGITAATAREMEDHAEEQAGGKETLAAMRIAELLGSGALLSLDDVVVVQDPDDPCREIIALREDLDG